MLLAVGASMLAIGGSQALAAGVKGPTRAQALAFAKAVNLAPGDLPGFTAAPQEKQHSSAAERKLEGKLLGCLGVSEHKGLVELGSQGFERETAELVRSVSSEVTVMPTASLATHALARIKQPRARTCLSHYFNKLLDGLKTTDTKVGAVKLSSHVPAAPGTKGSFGWHLSATITVVKTKAQLPFNMDIMGFVYGPAEVTLLTSGVPQPYPASEALRLFSLLVKRAETHSI
jgi:hypothetical protein